MSPLDFKRALVVGASESKRVSAQHFCCSGVTQIANIILDGFGSTGFSFFSYMKVSWCCLSVCLFEIEGTNTVQIIEIGGITDTYNFCLNTPPS